jgi:TonB family protein
MHRLLESSISRSLRVVAVAALVGVALSPVASAQTQAPTESELRLRMMRQPNDATPYLELAKMYADQRRYDEAIQLLQNAIVVIQRAQSMSVPPVRPAVPTRAPETAPGNAPVRVGGAIMEPKKIKHVPPVYPDVAQASRVQGVVILEVIIDPAGFVSDAKILRSVALLDQAAIDAVRQWEFTPTLLNGVPVSVVMTVTVNFSLK